MYTFPLAAEANEPDQSVRPAFGIGDLDPAGIAAMYRGDSDNLALLVGSQSAGEPYHISGDPYPQDDDVVRGCWLPPGPSPMSGVWGDCAGDTWLYGVEPGPISPFCGMHDPLETPFVEGVVLGKVEPQAQAAVFTDAVQPRECPFGQHESTTVFLDGASPAEAASCAHAFLTQEVMSSDLCVKPEKFVIKADVIVCEDCGGMQHCALKVRVLRNPAAADGGRPRLLVEFRRRRGDSLAFAKLFSRASQYILDRCSSGMEMRGAPACLEVSHPPEHVAAAAESELQPLVDMLANSSLPALQAEAVSRLVALASAGGAVALAVCAAVSHLQGVLTALVASTCMEVSYPAARLAAVLAEVSRGDLNSHVLLAARDGARFAGADSFVHSEYVEVCSADFAA